MAANMQTDRELFEKGRPCVRVYQWDKPTITYGYAQKLEQIIDLDKYSRDGWVVEQRPTGGGVVFHNKGNISFAIIMPRGKLKVDEAVAVTTKKIADFLKICGLAVKVESNKKSNQANLCSDYVSRNEISLNGKKLVGIAQRFGKNVILQQGTIFGDFTQIKLKELEKCMKLFSMKN